MEVTVGGRVTLIGWLVEPPLTEHVRAAEAVLRDVVATGVYVPEQSTVVPFVYHFDSVKAWLDYMHEWWTAAIIEPEMVDRARTLLADRSGEIRVRQTLRATRLRRS